MTFFAALLAIQVRDPYAAIAAFLPPKEWKAVQAYVGEGLHGGTPEEVERSAPPSFVAVGASPLAAQRTAVTRWAAILAGLRTVSERPYSPNAALTKDDFAAVKSLQRFVLYAANVRFADGDRHGAVTVLLDGLTMARRVRNGSTMAGLVGVACEALVLGSVEEHLAGIPLAECDRIRKAADEILAEGVTIPIDANAEIRAALADAPPRWVFKGADPVLGAYAKAQVQMRLLRLHMRIEAYRWRNLKLPVRLVDAAPADETVDPLTQAAFRYELGEGTYRLYSEGFPSQGPVGLRYRRDPNRVEPDVAGPGSKKP